MGKRTENVAVVAVAATAVLQTGMSTKKQHSEMLVSAAWAIAVELAAIADELIEMNDREAIK